MHLHDVWIVRNMFPEAATETPPRGGHSGLLLRRVSHFSGVGLCRIRAGWSQSARRKVLLDLHGWCGQCLCGYWVLGLISGHGLHWY